MVYIYCDSTEHYSGVHIHCDSMEDHSGVHIHCDSAEHFNCKESEIMNFTSRWTNLRNTVLMKRDRGGLYGEV